MPVAFHLVGDVGVVDVARCVAADDVKINQMLPLLLLRLSPHLSIPGFHQVSQRLELGLQLGNLSGGDALFRFSAKVRLGRSQVAEPGIGVFRQALANDGQHPAAMLAAGCGE